MKRKNKNYQQTNVCPICGLPLDSYDHKECDKKLEKHLAEERKIYNKIVKASEAIFRRKRKRKRENR